MIQLGGGGSKLIEPFTAKIRDEVWVRLYPDCRPNNLEASDLQKGLVLVYMGKEVVEEGVGFGAPVVLYSDGPHFSSTSESSVIISPNGTVILTKVFKIDAVAEKTIGGLAISNSIASPLDKQLIETYIRGRKRRIVMDDLLVILHALGYRTRHVKDGLKGTIGMEYTILGQKIRVRADLHGLRMTDCCGITIANEQGPTFFSRYRDSTGADLAKNKLSSWGEVFADWAIVSDLEDRLSFTLKRAERAKLFMGRERRGALSWIGLEYSLPPGREPFSYEIDIGGKHD
jgi:hypothetical protein